MGILHRRSGRQAGGEQQAVLLLQLRAQPPPLNEGDVNRYRAPTRLERKGDFSQTLDNNGNLYPYVKDYLKSGSCNATSQAGCFNDGGVVGRIPDSRQYDTGLAILKWWPEPNLPNVVGQNYNFESVYPGYRTYSYTPLIKVDYQPTQSLRGNVKYFMFDQPADVASGTIPGWNDVTVYSHRFGHGRLR